MRDFCIKSGFRQILPDLFGDHHGSVLSARAADRNREIAFSLANVMGKQVNQKVVDAIEEFPGLGERPDISRDGGILSVEVFVFGNVIRIRQKTDVEYQIALRRQPVAKAEAG